MSERVLVAEFLERDALIAAARQAREGGFPAVDALTPFPVEELDDLLALGPSPIRWPMLIGALVLSALAYGLEYWTSVDAYPINSGGRPLDSWPVFLLVPFEVGVLAAGVAGFAALLILCGLPRVDHPLFDFAALDRTSSDRFALVLREPDDESEARRLRDLLRDARASRVEGP